MSPIDQPSNGRPRDVVRPDARALRALAHPLRLRMLGILRADGPATATQLAARTGQNSGATSYHLRQLAEFGLVVEDDSRGNGRERWWRAGHRSTEFDLPPDADEESRALGEEYLRVVGHQLHRKMDDAITALPTMETDLGPGWDRAFTMNDQGLRLTVDEAVALIDELSAVVNSYRQEDPDRREPSPVDAQRVFVQFQVLPSASAPTTDEPTVDEQS